MLDSAGLHVRGDFRNLGKLGTAHAHFFLLNLACVIIVGMKASMSSQTVKRHLAILV